MEKRGKVDEEGREGGEGRRNYEGEGGKGLELGEFKNKNLWIFGRKV